MFWKIFISLCEEKNESPTSVCSSLGFSATMATKWKNGAKPRDISLKKIANYFGVSVDYLLGADEAEGQPEPIKEKSTPAEDGLDEYEKKLIGTFRETTIDGKLRILNAADEIKKEIEKNHTGSDSTFA